MSLQKLIGLEIQALMKEHEETLKNIALYEDILGSRASMAKVIIKELQSYKKEYARPRRTDIDNLEEVVVEEKKIEEMDVVFLMDRFGYAKTIDVSIYERNKETAEAENKYVAEIYIKTVDFKKVFDERINIENGYLIIEDSTDENGNVLVSKDTMMGDKEADIIVNSGVEKILVFIYEQPEAVVRGY